MKNMYIYELVDPRNSNVRYVGKSNKPELRYRQHWAEGYNPSGIYKWGILTMTYKKIWMIDLRLEDSPPILNILEACGANWREREAWWIEHYERKGYILLNGKETSRPMRRYNGRGFRRQSPQLAPNWLRAICKNINFDLIPE